MHVMAEESREPEKVPLPSLVPSHARPLFDRARRDTVARRFSRALTDM